MFSIHPSALLPACSPALQDVCVPTRSGEDELRGNATLLSPVELEILVRLDGSLTLAQILSGMAHVSAQAFAQALRGLGDRRLLEMVEKDLFQVRLQGQLDKLALGVAPAEADASLASLGRAGYCVGIARARGNPRSRPAGTTLTAVVVEDEPNLAKFVQSYLSFDGFQVRLAANRAQVSAEFSKLPIPDLVLLDVMLPDADGFEILLRLRQHNAFRNVPIIMLTGKATREAVIKGMAGGADGYVTKPFEAEALMRAVRTVLGIPNAPAQGADPWVNRDANAPRLRTSRTGH
ncbi:MAG: response regulator [Ramlibacter sp.]|nr:response regulator [Ramlibacter sp.]